MKSRVRFVRPTRLPLLTSAVRAGLGAEEQEARHAEDRRCHPAHHGPRKSLPLSGRASARLQRTRARAQLPSASEAQLGVNLPRFREQLPNPVQLRQQADLHNSVQVPNTPLRCRRPAVTRGCRPRRASCRRFSRFSSATTRSCARRSRYSTRTPRGGERRHCAHVWRAQIVVRQHEVTRPAPIKRTSEVLRQLRQDTQKLASTDFKQRKCWPQRSRTSGCSLNRRGAPAVEELKSLYA
jgi:hypothetical protein